MANKPTSSSDQTRLFVLMGLLVVLVVVWLVTSIDTTRSGGGRAAREQLDYARKDLPQLTDVNATVETPPPGEYRSPFTYGKPPTPTPNLTPPPTRPPVPVSTRPPRPTPTPTPRGWQGPPPPFNRDFLGHFGPLRLQVAAFRLKDKSEDGFAEVEVAVVGEVLDDSKGKPMFIIREIGLESVTIGFVGWPPSEEEIVPLADK